MRRITITAIIGVFLTAGLGPAGAQDEANPEFGAEHAVGMIELGLEDARGQEPLELDKLSALGDDEPTTEEFGLNGFHTTTALVPGAVVAAAFAEAVAGGQIPDNWTVLGTGSETYMAATAWVGLSFTRVTEPFDSGPAGTYRESPIYVRRAGLEQLPATNPLFPNDPGTTATEVTSAVWRDGLSPFFALVQNGAFPEFALSTPLFVVDEPDATFIVNVTLDPTATVWAAASGTVAGAEATDVWVQRTEERTFGPESPISIDAITAFITDVPDGGDPAEDEGRTDTESAEDSGSDGVVPPLDPPNGDTGELTDSGESGQGAPPTEPGSPNGADGFPIGVAVGGGLLGVLALGGGAVVVVKKKADAAGASDLEDTTPILGQPRDRTLAAPPAVSVDTTTTRLAALDAQRDALVLTSLVDGVTDLDRRLIDGQIALGGAMQTYRLGFSTVSAALAPADSVIALRERAVYIAQVADFIVALVQLGMLTVQGAKALSKLLATTDEVAEAATSGAHLATTADRPAGMLGTVDDAADAADDLTFSFAHTDDYASLNDSLAPGTWDPAILDDLPRLLSLTKDELALENVAIAQAKWGEFVDPVALARLAERAGVHLDEFRATRLRGRTSVPDHEVVVGLMVKVMEAEGWLTDLARSETFALQTLAARTTLLADRGLKFTLRPGEIAVLRRIATDADLATGLGRIPLAKVQRVEHDLEPMFTAAEAQNLRDLAEALFGGGSRPTQFALLHGATGTEVVVSAASVPLNPLAPAELAGALAAAQAGERVVVIAGDAAEGLTGVRYLTADGTLTDVPTVFNEALHHVAVAGEATLDAGVLAAWAHTLAALGEPADGSAIFDHSPGGTLTIASAQPSALPLDMVTIGGPFDLSVADLRTLADSLTAAHHAATNGVAVDPTLLTELRFLVGDNPDLLAHLTDVTITAGPVTASPFAAEAAVWLQALVSSKGDLTALRTSIGPIRLAGATHQVQVAGSVDMGSLLTTGVDGAIESMTGGFERPFILLGLEIETGVVATTANVGIGALTAPIESGQRVIFGAELFGTLWDGSDSVGDVMGDMRTSVRTAQEVVDGLVTLAGSGLVEDMARDLAELTDLIEQYESLREGADADTLAQIDATLAELRAIAGPAQATLDAVQSLEQLGGLADGLASRLTDPLTGDVRVWAPIESPTLIDMGYTWNTVRNAIAGSGVPPAPVGPTPATTSVQLPVAEEVKGEATLAAAIEVVVLS